MLDFECPACGEKRRLRGQREDDVVHITCQSCGHLWTHDPWAVSEVRRTAGPGPKTAAPEGARYSTVDNRLPGGEGVPPVRLGASGGERQDRPPARPGRDSRAVCAPARGRAAALRSRTRAVEAEPGAIGAADGGRAGGAEASVCAEAARRRTFAIISHPDAGKTTLTEKLLLYAGVVAEAGAVRAKRTRRETRSDWMELERRRGISVSSTALRFERDGLVLNLLDTPGHHDFSEDTLRVLAAVDSCVVLLDAAKGVEAQTVKLFEVARERRVPLLTFINKYDRPGREPLALLDEIETTLGVRPTPVTWPIGAAGELHGVIDRRDRASYAFERTPGGATAGAERRLSAQRAARESGAAWELAMEETALLDAVGADLDVESFLRAESTPVFFGSALSNFGVRLLLEAIEELAPAPAPVRTADGGTRALDTPFSAQVFKVQANSDPRHRDRVAFLRVATGLFERGGRAVNERTGRELALSYAHGLFGRERSTLDEAYPGDVVGVVNAGDLRVGDTVYVDQATRYPPIPSLVPEHFVVVRSRDASRRKQFGRGLAQLDEEGVVQVLRRPDVGDRQPILAGAGPLQFDVAVERLEHEFGVAVETWPASFKLARRTDLPGEAAVRAWRSAEVLHRADGTRLAVFASEVQLERFEREHPEVMLDRFVVRREEGAGLGERPAASI